PRPGGLNRLLKRALLKRYRKVWCVSRYVQECLAAQGTWSNLVSCLHFINTDRFRPDAGVRRAGRRDPGCRDCFLALGVANLIPEKGIDVAVRALTQTPADTVLWVVGTGPEAGRLQALAESLGLGHRVKLFGQQVHVQPFMQGADCLVCPSLW